MNKIRILYVLEACSGGTRRYLHDLAANLDQGRFAVSLAVSNSRDPDFNNDIDKFLAYGIDVHIIPMSRNIAPAKDLLAYWELSGLISRNNYDIVHTQSSKAGVLGRIAAGRYGIRKVYHTPHVFPFQMEVGSLRKSLYRRIEALTAKYTTGIIAVCDAERRVAIESGLFPETKTTVIHNGIDVDQWNPDVPAADQWQELGIDRQKCIVGLIGRLMPQKGHFFFLDVIEIVVRQISNIHFLFVGSGKLLPPIIKSIVRKKLEKYVTILEQTDNIEPWYALCDLVVQPSRWEALPYTILEAMAMKKPVIAPSLGGIPEIIDNGKNGFIVPFDDKQAFAERLIQTYRDRQNLTELGESARNKIREKFSLKKMVQSYEKWYTR